MAKLYVVGFLIDASRGEVVLIRKQRPDWQAGLLNGVGGKVEPGETPAAAMRREFVEETGVDIDTWEQLCDITWATDLARVADPEPATVVFFRARWDSGVALAEAVASCTDEPVEVHPLRPLPTDTIPNLAWLVPLAAYEVDRYAPFSLDATVVEVL